MQIVFEKTKCFITNINNRLKMSTLPYCCDSKTLYVGLDSQCSKPAIICTLHGTHPNPSGIMHNIMPITHFKTVVNELKFHMSDKVSDLVSRYNSFMDDLIAQITELKCRKSIQISTLWVRELAKTEDQYEQFKRIFRNDLEGFSCREIYNFYEKMLRGVNLKQKKLENIDCYKEIDRVLEKLATSAKARMLIIQKVADLQGIVQSGELLKRALPDRKILKENTREILLESHDEHQIEIRYNRALMKKGGNNYRSVFSKYPLLPNTNYHLSIKTKYCNVLVGVCEQRLKQVGQSLDLHYNVHSLAYNCSNGCLYRDAMFESGSAHLTKSKKEFELILRTNQTQMLILLDKNVVCRTQLKQFAKKGLFLHILMRTQGDSFQIDSDKITTFQAKEQLPRYEESADDEGETNTINMELGSIPSQITIDKLVSQKAMERSQSFKKDQSQQEIYMNAYNQPSQTANKRRTAGDHNISGLVDYVKKRTSDRYYTDLKRQREERDSIYMHIPLNKEASDMVIDNTGLDSLQKEQKSKVFIQIDTSLRGSNSVNDQLMLMKKNIKTDSKSNRRYTNDEIKLLNPAVIGPAKRSQFDEDFKDDYPLLDKIPSLNFIPRQISALEYVPEGLRSSEYQSSESG